MTLKFKFWKEEKRSDGTTTWSPYAASSDVSLEEISVESKAKLQIINYGKEPQIIPQGISDDRGRVALIRGTFTDRALEFDSTIDAAFDVLQDDDRLLGYALSLKDAASIIECPELGDTTCKWQITAFSWDRQAMEVGQWKFNAELSYIWDPNKNELMLYDDGIGINIKQNVKFSVQISDSYTRGQYNTSEIVYDPRIDLTIIDLNRASFVCESLRFATGDLVKMYCETQPRKAIFFGVVDQVKTKNGNIHYDCTEIGTLLQRVPCAVIGPGLFKPKIKIPNPYEPGQYYTLGNMIQAILTIYQNNMLPGFDAGLGIDKTGVWGFRNYVPGTGVDGSAKVMLPSLLLSGMNVFKAISTLLEDICGLHFWFDTETGAMEYGFFRDMTGKTIVPADEFIRSSTLVESYSEEFQAYYVVLYDQDGYHARSTTEDVTGKTYVSYKFDTSLGDLSLREVARRIAYDNTQDRSTYKVRFPAGTVRFMDGDVFTCLGDLTSTPVMPVRPTSEGEFDDDPTSDPGDTVWQIKDMTITDTYTECIVGASYYSIFDIYKNKLKRCSEAPVAIDTKDVTTNERVVTT